MAKTDWGMFNNVPRKYWTTTALRQEKRQQEKIDSFSFGRSEKESRIFSKSVEEEDARRAKNAKYFNENIWARVQKEHPEMSKIKARAYARTKDPVGRQFNRLNEAGKSLGEIKKTLRLNGKGGERRQHWTLWRLRYGTGIATI